MRCRNGALNVDAEWIRVMNLPNSDQEYLYLYFTLHMWPHWYAYKLRYQVDVFYQLSAIEWRHCCSMWRHKSDWRLSTYSKSWATDLSPIMLAFIRDFIKTKYLHPQFLTFILMRKLMFDVLLLELDGYILFRIPPVPQPRRNPRLSAWETGRAPFTP